MIVEKILILYLTIILLSLASPTALAAEATPSADDLPTVHLLPDNPLYFLKTLKEKIQLVITRSSSGQADLLLSFAQKRLAEALKVAEKGKVHISEKLFVAFGQDIREAQRKIEEARRQGEQTHNLLIKLQQTIDYQQAVLREMQEEAWQRSEEVQARIEALNDLLVQIDQSLGQPQASESGKIETRRPGKASGLGIGDWLKNLFGRREVLRPLAR